MCRYAYYSGIVINGICETNYITKKLQQIPQRNFECTVDSLLKMNYIFDGTYNGFLCCVFEYFEYKDSNVQLQVEGDDDAQTALFDSSKTIITDISKVKRVQAG